MPRHPPPPPGLITQAELARRLGVTSAAIYKAVKSGRIQAYNLDGAPWGTPLRRQKAPKRGSEGCRTGETPSRAMVVPDED